MSPKIAYFITACPFAGSGAGVRTLNIGRALERLGSVTTVVTTGREWTREQAELTERHFKLARFIKYQPWPHEGVSGRLRQVFDPRYLNSNGVEAPPADREFVNELIESHDVVWIHTLKLANAFRRFRWPRSVIDVDDIPSRYHTLAASQTNTMRAKLIRWRNAVAERRRESLSLERFDILTVCKESDRAHFNRDSRVHVVPNGFSAPEKMIPRQLMPDEPRIGMIGDFNHLPNADGLKWFIGNCWPEIQQCLPAAQLRLIGRSSDTIGASFNNPHVLGLGYVPDTGAEMATWNAMIVPTRLGGGTHLKVAEGLARRVSIVTTRHGARGYTIESGTHALIADNAADFSNACLRLLQNPAHGEQLSAAGWELFNARYSWESIGPSVQAAVEHCLSLNTNASPVAK